MTFRGQPPAKVLVIGASGFIGRRLASHLGAERVIATYYTSPLPDGVLFDSATMRLRDRFFLGRHGITHGLLLQGMTGIDRCALSPDLSSLVNVEGAINSISDMLDAGVVPIYVSSDSVFDGTRGPCTEDDPVCPILTFGKQTAEVETYLHRLAEPWAIARLTKVVAGFPNPRNILSEWIEAISRREVIRCAYDQILSPVDIDDVVAALSYFVNHPLYGLYNIAGPLPLPRTELLQTLLSYLEPRLRAAARIETCSLSELPVVEPRPKNCSLSNRKFAADSGLSATSPDSICARLARHYRQALSLSTAAR
jgi:dTDP-4-dehydrorhamnose reductase